MARKLAARTWIASLSDAEIAGVKAAGRNPEEVDAAAVKMSELPPNPSECVLT
jgi:hypothetical protein